LFAYTAWGKEAEQKPIGIAKRAVKADASYRGNCFRVMLDRDNLEELRLQAIDLANALSSSGMAKAEKQPS
jgi:hypothetical protein